MSDTALAPGTAIDLTNCDREPIHLLGAVQPIGALIALSADWMVSRVSANIGEFFNTTPGDLIGRPASIIFSGDAIHAMRNRLALLRSPDSMERIFRCDLTGDERYFDVANMAMPRAPFAGCSAGSTSQSTLIASSPKARARSAR